MTPARDQHDFDARGMRLPQSRQIAFGDLKLWIEQRSVDVGGQQTDGSRERLCHSSF